MLRCPSPQLLGAAALALVLTATGPVLAGAPGTRPRSTPRKKPVPPPAAEEPKSLATSLDEALRLYEALEYEQALEQVRRAHQYTRSVEDEVKVALVEGLVLGHLGQRDAALAAFRTGLLLKPDATLPAKGSPKVEQDFESVRESVRGDLAAQQPKPAPEPAPVAASPSPSVQTVEAPAASRRRTLSYVLLGGGAVAAGVGTYLGVSALGYNARRSSLTADEAVAARGKAQTQLAVGAVLLPVGLAALGTGVVLWVRTPAERAPTPSVSLMPLPGGAWVGTAGRF